MITGRPQKPIDWEVVDKLLLCQCKLSEIAAKFEIHSDTLERRAKEDFGMTFGIYASLKYNEGKAALRAKRFKMAMEGNTSIMLKLGELHLDEEQIKNGPNDELIATQNELMTIKAKLAILENTLNNADNQSQTR